MTRLLFLAALLSAAATTPASARDARVTTRFYSPSEIILVHGRAGIESTIEFSADEHIDNIAVGDSANWQVTPNKRASLVFVKPMQPRTRTNMTVVTDRHTYLFDLVAAPGVTPVYMLRFTYPNEPRPVVAIVPVAPAAAETIVTIVKKPPPEPTPADLNFGWTTAGARALLPTRVFDDGKSTWLAWGKDVSMPAILSREAKGIEGPVNYRVQGNYVVVDGVPGQLVLRQGKLMATLTPLPRPTPPATAEDLPSLAASPTAVATVSPQP